MTSEPTPSTPVPRATGIESYYRFHSRIYDATRWSFLFGRDAIVELAGAAHPAPTRILEVGCGTGKNLVRLARTFPEARITGVDLSSAMLERARHKTAPFGARIALEQRAYDAPLNPAGGFDLVLCSYALSMFNPGFDTAGATAQRDVAPGGHFAYVDFHATRFAWFARWMRVNHVRMDGHLRPLLQQSFVPVIDEVRLAYGGMWQYLVFVGSRKA